MFFYQISERWYDRFIRWWYRSHPKLKNIYQCPVCRGTDRTYAQQEGWGITLFECARCDTEWWS